MCGLVGIAGDLAYKDEATMRRMLMLDYFRGVDSTGLAAIRRNGSMTSLAKVASDPITLFGMQKFKDALNGNLSKVFIGHNRAATRGLVNHYNAHPYEVDHITGAHNGTLEKWSLDELEKALDEKFPVDSLAIITGIAKLGIRETISKLYGSWSIVYYDRSNDTLNFIRNKERPMWLAYTKEFDRIFWASEWPMINAATELSTTGYDLFYEEGTGHRFWATDENVHYQFDLNDFLNNKEKERIKPLVTKMEGSKPRITQITGNYHHCGVGGGNGHDPFHRRGESTKKNSTTNSGTSSILHLPDKRKRDDREDDIIHVVADRDDPFGGYITRERFDELTKYGCSWCSADVSWGEVGLTIVDAQEIVICPECSCQGRGSGTSRVYLTNTVKKASE